MADDNRNYYEILGARELASSNEIKAAYREKTKILHTDKRKKGLSPKEEQTFNQEWNRVQEANDTLGDFNKRRQYHQKTFGIDLTEDMLEEQSRALVKVDSNYSDNQSSSKKKIFFDAAKYYSFGAANMAWDGLKRSRLADPVYVLKNSVHYAHRRVSWRRHFHDHTWGLFKKFEGLKDTSATNHFLNIDASAVNGKETTENLIIKTEDGKPKYDAVGSFKALRTELDALSSQALDPIHAFASLVEETDQKVATLRETYQGIGTLNHILQKVERQAGNTLRIGDSAITETGYTKDGVRDYLDLSTRKVVKAIDDDIEKIEDPVQKSALEAVKNRVQELAEQTVSETQGFSDDKLLNVNIGNALQDFSDEVGKELTSLDGKAVQPVFIDMNSMVKTDVDAISNAALRAMETIDTLKKSADAFQVSIDRLKSNVTSIERNPDEEKETYVGGSLIARLSAHDTKADIYELDEYIIDLKTRIDSTVDGINQTEKEIKESFDELAIAIETKKEDRIAQRLGMVSQAVNKQAELLKNIPNILDENLPEKTAAAAQRLTEIKNSASKYVWDSSAAFKKNSKAMGEDIFFAPTHWALRQGVGLVDKDLPLGKISKIPRFFGGNKESKAFIARGKELAAQGSPSFQALKGRWGYKPGEEIYRTGHDYEKKGNPQKFMEQAWRGMESTDSSTSGEKRQIIAEHTEGFLSRGDINGAIDTWKWLATYYSSEAPMPEEGKDKNSTDRKFGVQKAQFQTIADQKKNLTSGGQKDPYDDESMQILKHMQGSMVALGSNNFRQGWRRAVNFMTNKRFKGDFLNELFHDSPGEYKEARRWLWQERILKVNSIMWPLRNAVLPALKKPITLPIAPLFKGKYWTSPLFAAAILAGTGNVAEYAFVDKDNTGWKGFVVQSVDNIGTGLASTALTPAWLIYGGGASKLAANVSGYDALDVFSVTNPWQLGDLVNFNEIPERTISPERLAHESKILAMIERLETHGLLDKDAIGLIYENSLKPAEKEAFDAARAERDAGDVDGNPSLLVQKLKELKDTLNISSNIGGHLSPLQQAFAGRRTTGVGAKLAADPTALTMAELEELGEQYSTLDPNLA